MEGDTRYTGEGIMISDNTVRLLDENKQLKEEIHQLLNNPDFAHQTVCGICGEEVSKKIDETSCINVKGSRLTWICNDCDNIKQKLEKIEELIKLKRKFQIKEMDREEYQTRVQLRDEFIHELDDLLKEILKEKE